MSWRAAVRAGPIQHSMSHRVRSTWEGASTPLHPSDTGTYLFPPLTTQIASPGVTAVSVMPIEDSDLSCLAVAGASVLGTYRQGHPMMPISNRDRWPPRSLAIF